MAQWRIRVIVPAAPDGRKVLKSALADVRVTESRLIHDLCASQHIPVWHGGMLESGIGRAGNVALASLPNFTLPGDISASKRYYRQDIVEPAFEVARDGTMAVPTGPGIGVQVVPERLEKVTVRRQEFCV